MDEDSSIKVLYYRNPHLMWVEVKNHDTYTLRQVGLFGIVPRQASLIDGERVCTKSDRWDSRVNDIVEEFLESKHQLCFKSTYRLDDDMNPTSIFSNQPHIFGEISSVRKQDGTRKQLVNCLDNSVYAYRSRNEFWQMLNDGRIKTKLDEEEESDILQKIKEYYQTKGTWHRKKELIFKCLSPSQVTKLQESTPKLTTANLERHHILTLKQETGTGNPEMIPKPPRHKIYQDFNCDSGALAPVEFVEDVIKKFTVVENKQVLNENTIKHSTAKNLTKIVKLPSDAESIVSKITVYDEEINPQDSGDEVIVNESERSNTQKSFGRANGRLHNRTNQESISRNENPRKFEELMKLKEKFKRTDKRDIKTSTVNTQNIEKEGTSEKEESSNSNGSINVQKEHKIDKKASQKERNRSLNQSQEYEEERSSYASPSGYEERLIAYGPPTNSPHTLVKKLVCMKIKDLPTKVEDTDSTWEGGNIDWEDDCKARFDITDLVSQNVPNLDKADRVSRNLKKIEAIKKKRSVFKVGEGTCVNDIESNNKDAKVQDLDEPKNSNSFVQSKPSYAQLKMHGVRHDNTNKQNEKDVIMTSFDNNVGENNNVDDNKENKTPALKSRSKLLEIMRKRKPKYNDSLSSTDDSSVKKDTFQLNDSLSTDDSFVQKQNELNDTSSTKSNQDSDEDLEAIHAKLNSNPLKVKTKPKPKAVITENKNKINVNPYKNLDGSKSVFVDNLVTPLLLAHTKNNNKILPQSSLRDIPFKVEIHNVLRNKQVKGPSRLQSVSWPYILRGHSLIMISAAGSGKTLGYLPSVCNLVLDYNFDFTGLGPICIIVCATALSVAHVARECRFFLNHQRVVTGFPGIDNKKLATDLLNGCDILVSTPSVLYRLLSAEIGVDLRRLTTVVLEDCERLDQVYELEIKAVQLYVKKMLKSRTDKQVKVQYVLASRKWCDFMTPLAIKAPDTIVTFAAFQECVLYSKTNTSVSFVKKNKKVDAVIEFLKETDESKLTVIVCKSDDEVDLLESTLKSLNIAVVACNNRMTIHDLYKIRTEEFSSILICCDGNLNHLNVNYANYLVHFSMPAIYSQFCARFAVLNEKYPSIFEPVNENVKVKILLEETNVEQLPKILNFIKRCSSQVPEFLNEVARKVLEQKDLTKAEMLVPVCDSLLSLGECVDIYTCQERHALLEGYDDPKSWMPCNGVVTFKIIHYKSAICYSARLLTHKTGEDKAKYPDTYKTLCMKLGMFFSKEDNKKLHGEPKVGDICAVAVRKNYIARCKVLKINSYEKGKAQFVVINLIDEELITVVRAVELYFLPEEFKTFETYVVNVRLAGIRPQDKDVTFSELAMNELKKITDDDEQLYLKGRVVMTVGNTIFVETLKACAELSALSITVVKYDFKNLLLDIHAIPNSDHLSKLQKLCDIGNLKVRYEPEIKTKPQTVKKESEHRWAHLDKNDWSDVIFSNTINPGKFFVRPQKFSKCINSLISDIKRHVEENPEQIDNVCVNDVVLAEFPDDSVYERAIIEEIIDESKVRCFFVDNADWREVNVNKLKPIPQKIIKQIPFQSIECRLIGLKPPGEEWTEFSTNWLHDNCLEDDKGNSKRMYVKYFTKEKAELTGGHKYGVILVDTTTEKDVVINKKMIELNLAAVNKSEAEYLEKPLDFVREKTDTSSYEDDFDELEINKKESQTNNVDKRRKDLIPIPIKLIPNEDQKVDWESNDVHEDINDSKITPYIPEKNNPVDVVPKASLKNIFSKKPIKSYPLVSDSDEDLDKWDVCIDEDLGKCFGLPKLAQTYNKTKNDKEKAVSQEFPNVTKNRENVIGTQIKAKLPAISDAKNERDKLTATVDEQSDEYLNDVNQSQLNEKTTNEATKYGNSPLAEQNNESHDKPDLEKITQETEDTVVVSQIQVNENTPPKCQNNLVDEDSNKIDNIAEGSFNASNKVESIPINKKAQPKVIDGTSVIKPISDLDVLKGEIKDVSLSLYDSDDNLSIITRDDKIEKSMDPAKSLLYKKETPVLDSDDTLSILTDNDKELSIEEVLKPNNSLDSDDSEFEVIDKHNIVTSRVVEKKAINLLDKGKEIENKNVNVNVGKVAKKTANLKADEAAAKFKGKIIPITEIAKSETNKKFKENYQDNKVVKVTTELKGKTITITETIEPVRTPQLVWRQNKHNITVKIKVIVDEYTLETGARSLKFVANQNEVKYAFEIELYGVIEHEKTTHSNKGQYILVTLTTMLKKPTKWLKLTKDLHNWIVYDVDSIDTSSDEEPPVNDDALKIIMDHHQKSMEDVDDDDDGIDDTSGYL